MNTTKIFRLTTARRVCILLITISACHGEDPDPPPFDAPSVNICNQTWMLKNLEVDKYRNGDLIPQVTDSVQWANLNTGAWCYFNNDSANGPIYGKLYNWYAVMDPRGLASQGWHVPSYFEFESFSKCLGGDTLAGNKIKEAGTAHWRPPNSGTNSSGFTALPGGARSLILSNAYFFFQCQFWTSTDYPSGVDEAWTRVIYGRARDSIFFPFFTYKRNGLSVRCVKD